MTHESAFTRREALRIGAAGIATLALPGSARAAQGQKIRLGLQLYSVRDVCAKDFDGALKQAAEMGFEGVEFAGYYKYKDDAAGLRKKLDELGLKAAGTHIGAGEFVGDKLKKTVEYHKTIGCTLLIVPGDNRFWDAEKSKELAEFMNKTADAIKSEGLRCGYHNHVKEFEKSGDKTWWDLFAERTTKDVVLQIDFGHVIFAGVDGPALVRKSPGRIKTTHIKGRLPRGTQGKKPFVGQDVGDWKAIVTACAEVGGTEWFTIEQEDYPDGKSSMECTKISLDGFKKILKEMGR